MKEQKGARPGRGAQITWSERQAPAPVLPGLSLESLSPMGWEVTPITPSQWGRIFLGHLVTEGCYCFSVIKIKIINTNNMLIACTDSYKAWLYTLYSAGWFLKEKEKLKSFRDTEVVIYEHHM